MALYPFEEFLEVQEVRAAASAVLCSNMHAVRYLPCRHDFVGQGATCVSVLTKFPVVTEQA